MFHQSNNYVSHPKNNVTNKTGKIRYNMLKPAAKNIVYFAFKYAVYWIILLFDNCFSNEHHTDKESLKYPQWFSQIVNKKLSVYF